MKRTVLIFALALSSLNIFAQIKLVSLSNDTVYAGQQVTMKFSGSLDAEHELIIRLNAIPVDTLTFSKLQSQNMEWAFNIPGTLIVGKNQTLQVYNIVRNVYGILPTVTGINEAGKEAEILISQHKYYDLQGKEIPDLNLIGSGIFVIERIGNFSRIILLNF